MDVQFQNIALKKQWGRNEETVFFLRLHRDKAIQAGGHAAYRAAVAGEHQILQLRFVVLQRRSTEVLEQGVP